MMDALGDPFFFFVLTETHARWGEEEEKENEKGKKKDTTTKK